MGVLPVVLESCDDGTSWAVFSSRGLTGKELTSKFFKDAGRIQFLCSSITSVPIFLLAASRGPLLAFRGHLQPMLCTSFPGPSPNLATYLFEASKGEPAI
jgi:hypothetical protein